VDDQFAVWVRCLALNQSLGLLQIEWVIFVILRAIPVFDGDAIAD